MKRYPQLWECHRAELGQRHQDCLLELKTINPLENAYKISFLQGQIALLEELLTPDYYLGLEKKIDAR